MLVHFGLNNIAAQRQDEDRRAAAMDRLAKEAQTAHRLSPLLVRAVARLMMRVLHRPAQTPVRSGSG